MKGREYAAQLFYKFRKPKIIKYLQELEELQWMSASETQAQQHQHLFKTLKYANTYVPYYQDLFKEVDFQPADFLADPESIQKIPFLTKSLLRQHRDRLITTEASKQAELYTIESGGTTGMPFGFTKDHLYRDYNFASDYHVMLWSGWKLGQPQYWLWGHVSLNVASETTLVSQAADWLMARYRSESFVLTPGSMEAFACTLEKTPDGVLWSYVSTVYRFAHFLQNRGHKIKIRAIYTAAEPLVEQQREFIQRIFGCPVFNNYSAIDTGDIASECEEHNGLHILTRNCYVEVVRDGYLVPDGEEGEYVITTLTNNGTPLIRYKIEDWGRKSIRQCPCGRGLPMLEVVEGRKMDLFKTRDNHFVYGAFANDLMIALGDVEQFQAIQKSLDLIVFQIVSGEMFEQNRLQTIEQLAKDVLGNNVEVRFEFVDHLPPSRTGKHRFLVSEVT